MSGEPLKENEFTGPDGDVWHVEQDGDKTRILDGDGNHVCNMPTTPLEAAWIHERAFKRGVEAGKWRKALEVRQAIGALAEEPL